MDLGVRDAVEPPGGGLVQLAQERQTGSQQMFPDGLERDIELSCGLLIAQSLHAYQHERRSPLCRQGLDLSAHLRQGRRQIRGLHFFYSRMPLSDRGQEKATPPTGFST